MRSADEPQGIAYWLMSPWIAALAAAFIGVGIGQSGKPCARLIASYSWAIRVISRITDSVKPTVRSAVPRATRPAARGAPTSERRDSERRGSGPRDSGPLDSGPLDSSLISL